MKKGFLFSCCVLCFLGMTGVGDAMLTRIGEASFDGGDNYYNLIWDDDNNGNSVVWLDYSHGDNYGYQTWTPENAWATNLSLTNVNLDPGYSIDWTDAAWRLPATVPGALSGSTGNNFTTSEMGHLYYVEFGKSAASWTPTPTTPVSGSSPFTNLFGWNYWSGTQVPGLDGYYSFNMSSGYQGAHYGSADVAYGIAIRSGNVTVSPVPVPGALVLFGSGLLGLAGIGRRRSRK